MRYAAASWLCFALLGIGLGRARPAVASPHPHGAAPAPAASSPSTSSGSTSSGAPGEVALLPSPPPGAGAAWWIERARQSLAATLHPTFPGVEIPAFAAAAERLRQALDRMRGALAARDTGFFVDLRDGSRALVELRILAGRRGIERGSGAQLAELTAAFRQLHRHYSAEEMRHRLGGALRPAEARHLDRLAAAARDWSARLQRLEALAYRPSRRRQGPGSPAAPPARPASTPPAAPALDPGVLDELAQLVALLDRIAAAPATLAGYLNALTRTDVALGTWAGATVLVAETSANGEMEPAADAAEALASTFPLSPPAPDAGADGLVDATRALDPAADELANDAGAGFVFAADLNSGQTWSYLKQPAGAASGAAWTSGSDLDPFDEYDEGSMPLDPGSLATPAAGEAWVLAAGSPDPDAAGTAGTADTGGPAELDASDSSPGPPAAAAPSADELARRLGGELVDGHIVIHGGVESAEAAAARDSASRASTDAGEPAPGAGASPWPGADPLLDWLAGAPPLCSPRPPACDLG